MKNCRNRATAGAVLVAIACWSHSARAEDVDLRGDASRDLFVTGTNLYLALTLELVINQRAVPEECRWCNPPAFDEDIRNALHAKKPRTVKSISDVLSYGVAPVNAFGSVALAAVHEGQSAHIPEDFLYIAEATTTAMVAQLALKGPGGRQRPAVHYRTELQNDWDTRSQNGSFYSGHASTSFALAVSSGTIASMRGYRLAPLVWATGLPIAAVSAYGRIASDAHWPSDVLIGTVMGAGIGFVMPYFLHSPVEGHSRSVALTWCPTLVAFDEGAGLGARGSF